MATTALVSTCNESSVRMDMGLPVPPPTTTARRPRVSTPRISSAPGSLASASKDSVADLSTWKGCFTAMATGLPYFSASLRSRCATLTR